MIRLRVAGGTIQSQWVAHRWHGSSLHAIIERSAWGPSVDMGGDFIVDVELEPEDLERLDGLRLARGS